MRQLLLALAPVSPHRVTTAAIEGTADQCGFRCSPYRSRGGHRLECGLRSAASNSARPICTRPLCCLYNKQRHSLSLSYAPVNTFAARLEARATPFGAPIGYLYIVRIVLAIVGGTFCFGALQWPGLFITDAAHRSLSRTGFLGPTTIAGDA
jgi:hypothetical protein